MRLRLLFISVCLIIFLSCSESPPSVSQVSTITVIDHGEASPAMRLCVFISIDSDIRSASDIRITNVDSGLEWSCDDLVKFTDEDGQNWAGCVSFYPAANGVIPKGAYTLVYEEASGETCESGFHVNYPDSLLTATAADFAGDISVPFETRLAVYSEDDVLLYFGEEQGYLSDRLSLQEAYENASYFTLCYFSEPEAVLCIMPAEYLTY